MCNINPAIWGFAGTVLGAGISFLAQTTVEKNRLAERKKNLTAAIYGEIKALLVMCHERQYLKLFQQELQFFSIENHYSPKFDSYLHMQFPDNFFLVYKNNISDIGLLDSDIVPYIVQFYQALFALLEDATTCPGRAYNDAVNMVARNSINHDNQIEIQRIYKAIMVKFLNEDIKILTDALDTGEQVCSQLERKNNFLNIL